jgi:hypothetical protein
VKSVDLTPKFVDDEELLFRHSCQSPAPAGVQDESESIRFNFFGLIRTVVMRWVDANKIDLTLRRVPEAPIPSVLPKVKNKGLTPSPPMSSIT